MARLPVRKLGFAWILRCIVVAIISPCMAASTTEKPAVISPTEPISSVVKAAIAGAPTVVKVQIKGLKPSDLPAAQALIATRPGSPFSENVAKLDQKNLMASGLYEDVAVISSKTDAGVVVTFIVAKRFIVKSLTFTGNKHYKDKKLKGEIASTTGAALNHSHVSAGVKAIENLYRKAGYYFVAVSYDQDRLEKDQAIIYNIVEGPRVRLRSVNFEFVTGDGAFADIKLSSLIQSGSAFWVIIPGRLDDEKLASDISTLRKFYRDKGYLDAEVTQRLDFTQDRKKADVTFVIDEGPRYRIASVRFIGNRLFADGELLTRLNMTRGENHDGEKLQQDVKALRNAYGRLGFINAAITPRTIFIDPSQPAPADLAGDGDNAFVSLIYDITEGSRYKLGRIEIRGNTVTKDRVIRRQLQMHPGNYFDGSAMEMGKENLRRCGLFSKADITPFGYLPDSRDALVTVEEGYTAEVGFGITASSDSGFGGTFRYRQHNFSWTRKPKSMKDLFLGSAFKGDGQTLEFSVEPGTQFSRANLSWSEPRLLDGPLSLSFNTYAISRYKESYDEEALGVRSSLGRSLGGLWYGEIFTGFESYNIGEFDDDTPSEFYPEKGYNMLASVGAALVRNGTDNYYLPSRGGKMTLSATQYAIESEFIKTKAEYVHYWTPYMDALDRKHIIAIKGWGEYIFGNAPHSRMYYGGGMSHVRGFENRGISPRTIDHDISVTPTSGPPIIKDWGPKDDPVGGNFRTYAGLEYTMPLVAETIRGVLFLDSGTVEKDYRVTAWRISAGFGFHLNVANMPVKLNFGFPILEEQEDDNELLSFNLGWVF